MLSGNIYFILTSPRFTVCGATTLLVQIHIQNITPVTVFIEIFRYTSVFWSSNSSMGTNTPPPFPTQPSNGFPRQLEPRCVRNGNMIPWTIPHLWFIGRYKYIVVHHTL
jgi:hypothetical protein